tara:strand:- start:598 stop:1041 length:444 start_codon:yes stop_codon:yes gene_type:complete
MKFKQYLSEQEILLHESLIDSAIETITSKAFKWSPDKLALGLLKSTIDSLFVNTIKKQGIEQVTKATKPKLDSILKHVKKLKPAIYKDLNSFINDKVKEMADKADWELTLKKVRDPKYGKSIIDDMKNDREKLLKAAKAGQKNKSLK